MTASSALIGHTGFLGETLKRSSRFDACFRSTDIGGIDGRAFDLVVCAGAPAAKWKANQDPAADRDSLARLVSHLSRVTATRFVLLSTIDVFSRPVNVDEDSPVVGDPGNAYGRHRRELELFCRERFDATVVRLPALFGPGLRKNAIYDLLNGNDLERLQPRSIFQFYDVGLLWADVERLLGSGVKVAHVASEPVALGEVAREVFGRPLAEDGRIPVARYDFRTRWSALWGRQDGYCYGREETLDRLRRFAAAEPTRSARP